MTVIENFAALSEQEQREFAEALLKTINTENIFTSETNFEIANVGPDELSGGLWIEVVQANPIDVPRAATWQCADEDEAYNDPGYDAEYDNNIYEDARKAFKALSAVIDGYKVVVDVADVDEIETTEVDVDEISYEDSGIGEYEYWGDRGYDSHPYVEVKGDLIKSCDCAINLFVEVAEELPAEPEVEEEI